MVHCTGTPTEPQMRSPVKHLTSRKGLALTVLPKGTLYKEQFQAMENKLSKVLNSIIRILWEGLANTVYILNHTSSVSNNMINFIIR